MSAVESVQTAAEPMLPLRRGRIHSGLGSHRGGHFRLAAHGVCCAPSSQGPGDPFAGSVRAELLESLRRVLEAFPMGEFPGPLALGGGRAWGGAKGGKGGAHVAQLPSQSAHAPVPLA